MHLADAFIQSDLHCIQVSTFLSALAFPGNRTHDLGIANAMLYQLSYRKVKTGVLLRMVCRNCQAGGSFAECSRVLRGHVRVYCKGTPQILKDKSHCEQHLQFHNRAYGLIAYTPLLQQRLNMLI